ncbi:MAG: hypothetical protein COW65_13810 [Cytophagales bacterium CG18_big_fil_WC_8_21_14_2_50_42_9]|nr:MAG: hypothetical protein COW65_13810 [Cytophagales bacterium CG18_big_fil_WC_8_21_14_2_50_42_9]
MTINTNKAVFEIRKVYQKALPFYLKPTFIFPYKISSKGGLVFNNKYLIERSFWNYPNPSGILRILSGRHQDSTVRKHFKWRDENNDLPPLSLLKQEGNFLPVF